MIIARDNLLDKTLFLGKPTKEKILITGLGMVFTSPLYMPISGFYPEPFIYQEGLGFPLPFIGQSDPFNGISAAVDLVFWYLISLVAYDRWFT